MEKKVIVLIEYAGINTTGKKVMTLSEYKEKKARSPKRYYRIG